MTSLRASVCLTLVGSLIASAPVHADTDKAPLNEDAPNAPTPARAPEGQPSGGPMPPPPPAPAGAAGEWQWKPRNPDPKRASLLEQGRILRAQIEDLKLERRRYGIGGPITLLAIGTTVALGSWSLHSDCYDCSDKDGYVVMGVVGVAMSVLGAVMLSNRLGPRRELADQINGKIRQLREVEDRLHYSLIIGPNNLRGGALAFSF